MVSSPTIAIVGQTASGKTNLAIELALKYGGEIICADSRTIYKGMDIGTAKPTLEQRKKIPHHGLDLISPDQKYSAADFQEYSLSKIAEIHGRNKIAFIVGGSGLYIDAILYNFEFSSINAPRAKQNPRHLSKNVARLRGKLAGDTLILGIKLESAQLKQRIEKRVEQIIQAGLVDEVRKLRAKYPGSHALLTPGYKALSRYQAGEIDLEEAKMLFARSDYQLARRQLTWFKRNLDIHWINSYSEAEKTIDNFLK